MDAEMGSLKGVWVAPTDGILVIQLDNKHSKLRSKTITYKVEV